MFARDAAATCCAVQIDKCFGFDTAVEEAQRALLAAKVEAVSGYRGLGIVKLMGRSSGFIAMQASMASGGLQGLNVCTPNPKCLDKQVEVAAPWQRAACGCVC